MKLIQSLDISEGISMDSLKPIINSGSEATFDSCLGMKDAVMDDHLLHSEKRSQICQQKDKSLTDIDVECIGNNAKKMFEKVDLNSSDISIKRDSWNSGADYDKSSEKENMGESNDVGYDYLSDDESESIHLKMSSDEDNSLGDADIQKTGSKDVQNKNMSENSDISKNDEMDSDEGKTCSNNKEINSTEQNTKVDENSVEESVTNKFLSCLDEKPCHDTLDVSSADGFECTPSCSKENPHVSGINSSKIQNEVINEISDEEQEIDITYDEKLCFNLTKNESENALIPPSEDSMSVKMPDKSEELSGNNDDNLSKTINNKHFHLVNSEIDKVDNCAFRTKRQSKSDDNGSGAQVMDDSSLEEDIGDKEINDSKPLSKNSSVDVVFNGKEKSSGQAMRNNLCDDVSDEENKVVQHHNDNFKFDESKASCSEIEVVQTLQKKCNNPESNNQLLDKSEEDNLPEKMKMDCILESGTVNSLNHSYLESSEEHMDCSDNGDTNTNDQVSVLTDNSTNNPELDIPSHKDLTEFRDGIDSTEDNECKQLSDPSNERKTQLHLSKNEVPSSRKRTSPNADEKTSVSSKRSKVARSDSDDSDITLVDNKSSELNEKNCNSTKEDVKEENELAPSVDNVNSDEVSGKSSTGNAVEKMIVSESVDKKEVLANSDSDIEPKKESESAQTVKVNPLPFLRNFNRAQLQTMTRNDLEELVLQKICEAITERSVCGELREIAVSLDQKLKAWQKKSFQLSKQVKDLSVVVKRYGSDLQNKGPNVVPMKITRSVGLQVQMPGSGSGHWNQDESWRKGEKVQPTAPTSMTTTKPTVNSLTKTTPSSPGAKLPPNSPASQKGVENTNTKVNAQSPVTQNTQSASTGLKVLQTKSPISATPPSSSSKTSQKQSVSSVNNRLKTASDLQVIDLTDTEDKSKSANSLATTNAPSTETTSTVVTSINSSPITSVGCRSIRVVQHLGSTSASPLLTQTVTTAVAGQRLAYYVPTTTVPRQLIISNPPVRPSGVVVSHRPSSIPAIVLKPGPMVPVSAVAASNANIIRTSNVTNVTQAVSARPQPRTTHYLHRGVPVSGSPLQSSTVSTLPSPQHPAPLPPVPTVGSNNPNWKLPPPKPDLKISKVPNRNQQGIVLSWNMTVSSEYEEIASYQLFAYQEGSAPPSTQLWKKVGDVKALPLPMACTLTQFMEGHKYHFAVRAVDVYARYGPFSSPGNIVLTRN